MVVTGHCNNPLNRSYFLQGMALGGGTFTFHDIDQTSRGERFKICPALKGRSFPKTCHWLGFLGVLPKLSDVTNDAARYDQILPNMTRYYQILQDMTRYYQI